MSTKPTEDEVRSAIWTILSDVGSYSKSLNYAVNYCRAGINMEGEELRAQVPYILNNVKGWRHPKAKEVRKVLKDKIS